MNKTEARSQPITVLDYHERSKHQFDRYAAGPGTIDWQAQPDPFRRFEGCTQIALPLLADTYSVPYADLFRNPSVQAQPCERDAIALMLEMSLGLSA